MSQAVRRGIILLAVLLLVLAVIAVAVFAQKKTLEEQNQNLQAQLTEYQNKESQLLAKAKKLQDDSKVMNDRVVQKDKEKTEVQGMYDELKAKYDAVDGQMVQVTRERDDWKGRLETTRRERDELMNKLRNQPEKIVYKEREPAPVAAPQGEGYWAQVLKEKAVLQLELEKVKSDLEQSVLQIVDLKKQNSDMQLEIKTIQNEKEEIVRKIKYGEDLANNLSVEVARARNDQKMTNERADKLKDQNHQLQDQIKQLTTTKVALERSLTRLGEDKDKMGKKLTQTESVIQDRIDEIWQIKQNLDQKITDFPVKPSPTEVELPPIVVNAVPVGPAAGPNVGVAPREKQHTVISINETNNFVIVDLGEADGSRVGQALKVYRGGTDIASLEVIQVRKDISAADIKNKSVQLKVGDIVR